jgi:hypothetical protein
MQCRYQSMLESVAVLACWLYTYGSTLEKIGKPEASWLYKFKMKMNFKAKFRMNDN